LEHGVEFACILQVNPIQIVLQGDPVLLGVVLFVLRPQTFWNDLMELTIFAVITALGTLFILYDATLKGNK
jgi:hypothetical protein